MKPNFALSLSLEGIRLLHRAAGGWREVGEVSLSAADMEAELATLRKTAASLEPGGVRSKLIIPNSQVKFLTIDTADQSQPQRRKAAEAALAGATPYEVAELAYDISSDGARTHIAAVAYETLEEAEEFAREHRFHPVSFVAIPEGDSFLGEPFFGVTEGADALLEPGDEVEADGIAIIVVGPAEVPAVEPALEDPPAQNDKEITLKNDEPTTKSADEDDAIQPEASASLRETETSDAKAEAPETVANEADEELIEEDIDLEPRPPGYVPAPLGFSSRRKEPNATTEAKKLGGASRDGGANASHNVPAPSTVQAPTPVQAAPLPDSSSLDQPAPHVLDAPTEAKPGFLSRRKKLHAAMPAAAVTATAGNEADRMTVFGARESDVGGKPRFLGLILTAVLLVLLAGVAAWATVFMDDGVAGLFSPRQERATASNLENQIDPEIIRTTPEASTPIDPVGIAVASLEPGLIESDATVLAQPETQVITANEADARYAVTGVWPLSPDVPQIRADLPTEVVYLNSLEQVSATNDAIALPGVDGFETDAIPVILTRPAPYGALFGQDPNALVAATPEGTLAPGGYTVFLGSPPQIPPNALPEVEEAPEVVDARAALVDARPRTRPSGLQENAQRAQLNGLTVLELAGYRPALRPASVLQAAESDARAALAAEAAAQELAAKQAAAATQAAIEAAIVAASPTATATRLAVAQSRRPDTRPRNFARIVKRAQRTAPKETRTASAATVAPRTVKPSVPSTASVARSATVKNAINLRRVNLIGVYGKPSSRRALVRLSNGRYKKVTVGDRIDGGRVSAIGDSDLRYTKGGRNVTLKMPKG
ncbi:hypothetical protein C1J03_08085 [Sulfitobacter sp. SK012]|uniref:hypothetical protein n=1 Tax=Sulfitobacter sp. SK012 TaxID=1389005 RepID=UPI000E0A5BDF|nr:hypothetical protein [Sulfitobacter sp. SK012]AXI45982.1 hypothetical protein C1J03_08085 [Sulfitobacter sp. SK012]